MSKSSPERQYTLGDLAWPAFAAVVGTTWVVAAGAASSLAVGAAWLWASLPGFALFRRHNLARPVNAAVASVVGVAASLTAVSLVGAIGRSYSLLLVALVPLLLTTIAWRLAPQRAGDLVAGGGSRWAILPALVALGLSLTPLLMVGLEVEGSFHFTPFFNADFFKHTAHVESIARTGLPPEDAFAAGHRLAYYWIQYLLPATAVRLAPASVTGDRAVLATTVVQTTVLALVLFGAARRYTRRSVFAAVACTLALLSLSLDGVTQQIRSVALSPLMRMMTINQSPGDITLLAGAHSAVASVTFLRLNLYTPQHQLAIVLLAAWVALLPRYRRSSSLGARASRLALILPLPGISLMTGGLASAAMAVGEWRRSPGRGGRIAAASTLVLAFALCFATGMLDPTAASGDRFLRFLTGPRPPLWERLLWSPVQILAGFGVTALLSVWTFARCRRLPLAPGLVITFAVVALILAEFLPGGPRLTMESQYKTSYVAHFGFLLGTALWLELRAWRRSAALTIVAIVLGVAGLVSPIHDVVWFSTFAPQRTTTVPADDMATLRWIRAETPPDMVFQQAFEAPTILGGRDAWVPIFGARAVRFAPRSAWSTDADLERASLLLEPGIPEAGRLALARELQVDALYVSRTLQPAGFGALSASLEAGGWIPLRRTAGSGVWLRPDLGATR